MSLPTQIRICKKPEGQETITVEGPGIQECTSRHDPQNKVIYVDRLFIHPENRQKGVGRETVKTLEATARLKGVTTLRVLAYPSSVGFWQKVGFKIHSHGSGHFSGTKCIS